MPAPTSPGSGSSPEFSAADRRQLKDALKGGVRTVGRMLNDLATRTELEQQAGLFLTDDDDEEGLADPVASILGRRGGLAAAANPDVSDVIRAAITLAAYCSKQLALRVQIRRADRGQMIDHDVERAA